MKREHFVKVVEETLDSLPQEFRSRIRNVAVLVEDVPRRLSILLECAQQSLCGLLAISGWSSPHRIPRKIQSWTYKEQQMRKSRWILCVAGSIVLVLAALPKVEKAIAAGLPTVDVKIDNFSFTPPHSP